MIGIVQANLGDVLANEAHGIIGHSRSCIFGAHGQSLMAVMVPSFDSHGGVPHCPITLADVMLATRRVCLQPGLQLEARTVHRRRNLPRMKIGTKTSTGRRWLGGRPIGSSS